MKQKLHILLLILLTTLGGIQVIDEHWLDVASHIMVENSCEFFEDSTELTEESPALIRSHSVKKSFSCYLKPDFSTVFYPIQDVFLRLYKNRLCSIPKQEPGYGQLFLHVLY